MWKEWLKIELLIKFLKESRRKIAGAAKEKMTGRC
jgi:hypothetical protein